MLQHIFLAAGLATAATALDQIPFSSSAPHLASPPLLGFGTWNLDRNNATEAVSWAIQTGYRHIDCAAIYGNEKLVGAGITDGLAKTGLSRSDLWITSKLWNTQHSATRVPGALKQTLDDLNISYLDLYHMHWPVSQPPSSSGPEIDYVSTWLAMSALLASGTVRNIGVSNFSPAQLEDLINTTRITPFAHQMELHPYLQQSEWIGYHKEKGIHVTAYSPLGGTNPTYHRSSGISRKGEPVPLLDNDAVGAIAKARGCTPAQVVLSWGIERGTSVIPKSSHKNHISENFGTSDCDLTDEDLRGIDGLAGEGWRYNNPSKSWGVPLYEGLEDA